MKQSLVVIQDMLRVFIIRIACQKADNASLLLQPIMSWIRMRLSESSCQTDVDAYKVIIFSLLEFSKSKAFNISSVFHLSKKKKNYLFSVFQIYRLLDFLACLLEHPRAKVFHPLKAISVKTFLQMNDQIYNHFSPYQPLLLKEGAIQMLIKALERCVDATESDGKQLSDGRNSAKCSLTAFSWCLPLCKSLSLICDSHMSRHYIGNYAK